jgi:hypothetical protein
VTVGWASSGLWAVSRRLAHGREGEGVGLGWCCSWAVLGRAHGRRKGDGAGWFRLDRGLRERRGKGKRGQLGWAMCSRVGLVWAAHMGWFGLHELG